MSGGVLYANASIIMQGDTNLLTRKRIRAMVAAPDRAGVLAVLAECGYATDYADDNALIDAERTKTLNTFTELCDDPALTQCVQAIDQLTETNYVATFDTLAALVPHLKTPSIRTYFQTLADLINVRTFYKGGKTMVPGGTLAADELAIFPGLTPAEIEPALEQRLTELAAVDKDDIFRPNPLFWWYCQKQRELTVVRTILLAKRFNYDAARTRTSLRGLYEQFQ